MILMRLPSLHLILSRAPSLHADGMLSGISQVLIVVYFAEIQEAAFTLGSVGLGMRTF